MDSVIVGIVIIILLGIASQLIAWFTRLPSILLLIAAGFIAGPLLGIFDPDTLLGDLFEPIVSLSVAVILFEGGLNLKINDIKSTTPVVLRLITGGVLITWVIASLGAIFILGLDMPLAILMGAILVISGPTVIMPLLRYLRPGANVSAVLKWEGILIDPIGAVLALVVLEIILAGSASTGSAVLQTIAILSKSLIFGGLLGAFGAWIIMQALRRHILPDYLHIAATLGILSGVFLTSELIQTNAGLVAAIVMGAMIANLCKANISHILEFKENLTILLVSFLFIILSARLELSSFNGLALGLIIFVFILVIFVRPLAVFISARRSKLGMNDKLLLSSIAPRGIVSASIASVFAFRLTADGYSGGELLLPVTFAVIFGTILTSSIIAPLLIKGLKISQMNPQGVVFIGGQIWARDIATLLTKKKIKCLIIDDDKANVAYAKRKGLEAIHADALKGSFLDDTDFNDYGYVVAITADDNYNILVALRMSKSFGRSNVFILPTVDTSSRDQKHPEHLPGRLLFGAEANYDRISELYDKGKIRLETLYKDTTVAELVEIYGKGSLSLFTVDHNGLVTVISADIKKGFKSGTDIVTLMPDSSK
ncbi:MAG: sodium:proton antiporter [Dehalococcoidales bacterium]|nr:sodium:proton antiporter [Dehalococcoidales bacterium]